MKLLLACILVIGTASSVPEEANEDLEDEAPRTGTTCACGWANRERHFLVGGKVMGSRYRHAHDVTARSVVVDNSPFAHLDYNLPPRQGVTLISDYKARIVGGQETSRNQFPLVVALQGIRGGQFCGGTILTPWHVLTAAHCTVDETPSSIFVNVGAHNMGAQSEGVIAVERIINHENYNDNTLINDIALLVTRTQIRFNQNVGPACLPSTRLRLVGQFLTALGWGLTTHKGQASSVLRRVDLPVISTAECMRSWRNVREATNICTFAKDKDTCQGDSGGPLIWLDPSTNRYTIAALTSYGGTCAGSFPGVNTDVSAYLAWINSQISSTKSGVRACAKV